MSDELRELLEASVKEAENKPESVIETAAKLEPEVKEPEVKEPEAQKPEVKDPEGEKQTAEEPKKPEEGTEQAQKPLLASDKAPSGWAPAVREKWATIPEDVRAEIIRREEASALGVRKLQQEVEPMRGFVQQLNPFIQEAAQNGQNPGQYIGQVMASEKALRNPDQNARFEALLQIADSYNIPLREVINASIGREVIAARPQQQPQVPDTVARELEANRRWRQQQEEQATLKLIEDFKKDNEFFDDVSPFMANMIQAEPSLSLKEAYERAIWAHAPTREVILSRQKKDQELKGKQAAAASASAKSSEEVHVRTRGKNEESTLDDDLRESIVALSGRA